MWKRKVNSIRHFIVSSKRNVWLRKSKTLPLQRAREAAFLLVSLRLPPGTSSGEVPSIWGTISAGKMIYIGFLHPLLNERRAQHLRTEVDIGGDR